MSQLSELSQLLTEAKSSRRNLIQKAAAGSIALATGSLLLGGTEKASAQASPSPTDVLNFALNLEYLEAEYYLFATTGSGLSATDSGLSSAVIAGDVFPTSGPVVFQNYGGVASDIAKDELDHVRFLRQALGGAAVSRPPVDLVNSFNAAASAAGIGATFNPFANEVNFILGAFVFEDVGVTAYHGGAGYLASSSYLNAAAGILGTEAYHAGTLRSIILSLGQSVVNIANQISALRIAADKAAGGTGDETPIGTTGSPMVVSADANSIAYARTPAEVLNIVYLEQKPYGGFFPSGLNGTIK